MTSSDVNAYLRDITGAEFTAKDFRTWSGTVLAATALHGQTAAHSVSVAKKNVVRAIEAVSGVLGNTPTVCRKSYIHPAILECYMDRSMEEKLAAAMAPPVRRLAGKLRADELIALRILLCMRSPRRRSEAA